MNIDNYIDKFTTDTQTRQILKQIASVDDSPDSRFVLKNFLTSELTDLIAKKTPNLVGAARAFVCAPEPKNLQRGFQLYIWLKEKIPEEHDRESLILLGMMKYIEAEKRSSVTQRIVDFVAIR